jgi:hypothetical protein
MQLGAFLFVWLREAPYISSRAKLFWITYGLNLGGAALWCATGVYIHLFEPLPTERTFAWLVFLELGAVTPLLFPLVCMLAFAKVAPSLQNFALPFTMSGIMAVAYSAAVMTGVELNLGGLLSSEMWITPWHVVNGTSYGGMPYGIEFDLLSSYPCYRGDSMYVLSTFFLLSNLFAAVLLKRAASSSESGEARAAAWRLMIAVSAMFLNCVALLYLLVVFQVGLSAGFDVFHAGQGVIMAISFFQFQSLLRAQSIKQA